MNVPDDWAVMLRCGDTRRTHRVYAPAGLTLSAAKAYALRKQGEQSLTVIKVARKSSTLRKKVAPLVALSNFERNLAVCLSVQ